MKITPSYASALLAGLWSGLGLLPFQRLAVGAGALENVLWFGASVLFFLAPVYFLVIGRAPGFARGWHLDPAERARYAFIVKRMLTWLAAAAAMALAVSAGMRYF